MTCLTSRGHGRLHSLEEVGYGLGSSVSNARHFRNGQTQKALESRRTEKDQKLGLGVKD